MLKSTGVDKSRLTVVSMRNSLLFYYLLITILFICITTVNPLLPTSVYDDIDVLVCLNLPSATERHLCCFQFFDIINKVAKNIWAQNLVITWFFISLTEMRTSSSAGFMVIACLHLRNKLLSSMGLSYYLSNSCVEWFDFPILSAIFSVVKIIFLLI